MENDIIMIKSLKKTKYVCSFILLVSGCSISPVPKNIIEMHAKTKRDIPEIVSYLQPGDVLFRKGETPILGGLMDFSQWITDITQSDFSHATLVHSLTSNGVLVADVNVYGIELRFLRDYYIEANGNFVVKRLKSEYRYLIPQVIEELNSLVEADVLYDEKFACCDDLYYCTEVVDECFRRTGYPLTEKIKINELPGYGSFEEFACLVMGINPNSKAVFAGNNEIGLFSSEMLEIVIDKRESEINENTNSYK